MSVENVQEALAAEGIEQPSEQNPVEQLAAQYGWVPTGERSAEEFVKYALEQHPARGKELKQLHRTIEELKVHMQGQEKKAYERAMRDLQTRRQQAIAQGDVDMVNALDQEKEQLAPPPSDLPHPAIVDFTERYAKYLNGVSYEEMQVADFIQKRDRELARFNLAPDEHMQKLEDHVIKQFPEYFGQSKNAPSVESGYGDGVSNVKTKKKFSFADLNPEQKQCARDFERMGVMKIDEYISDLVKSGDLK